ncbi:uncharacterized protein, partial [Maniola hyperantus]|uniref:uncharacterized protein n=1 Tax=Aphantopus hyperantus TaxID=2795564 RepID=UPI0037498A9D
MCLHLCFALFLFSSTHSTHCVCHTSSRAESAGAPLWAWSGAQGAAERLRALAPRGDVAALAALLPLLARALHADCAPPDAERLVRAARRAVTGGSGALLWALRLEAEARAPRPRLQHALYAALDAAP